MNARGKQTKRIYMAFRKHAKAIIKRHYHGAYYLFARESDRAHYQNLFDSPEWPEYKVNRQTGKIFTLYETFQARHRHQFTHVLSLHP